MKAIVFLADGFEECEGLLVVDILRRAGIETIMASVTESLIVDSSRHIKVYADTMANDVEFDSVDLIVLPGGRLGTINLQNSELVREKCIKYANDKLVAAVCAAPSILAGLGLLRNKKATVHPDFIDVMADTEILDSPVVVDGNIITGKGLGATIPFALELVKIMVGEHTAKNIARGICFRV